MTALVEKQPMKPQLFVVVATGQGIANLPPILELAQAGDEVLWIESPDAAAKKWRLGPQARLALRNIREREPIACRNINDPATLATTLQPHATALQGRYSRTYIVANGGMKLTPMGLELGLAVLKPQFLYGDDKPCGYAVHPPQLSGPQEWHYYSAGKITLEDILASNGYQFQGSTKPRLLWPGPLPTATSRYDSDAAYTLELHDRHYHWAKAGATDGKDYTLAEIKQLVPHDYAIWHESYNAHYRNAQHEESLFNGARNLNKAAGKRDAKQHLTEPGEKLGDAFEGAVAARLWQWLEAKQPPSVAAVWCDVSVSLKGQTAAAKLQFDVLLVLRNGVLLHLECKGGDVKVRDLQGNDFRMKQTSSNLAQLVVVLPLYTAAQGATWFQDVTQRVEQLRTANVKWLPFTLRGHAATTKTETLPFDVPTFEEGLMRLLKPYLEAG